MRILLFTPMWTRTYGVFSHFAKRSSVLPPLNLTYLATVAENMGHEVKIVDCEAENLTSEQLLPEISKFRPDLIGTTSTTPIFHFTVEYAKKIKENFDIPIALGGSHVTVLKEKAMLSCFDYGFVGEAEKSFEKFLMGYFPKGLIYPEPIKDIDYILPPARHLLKMDKYRIGTSQGVKKVATIMASRGCPFHCIFCTTSVFGEKVRRRTAEFVVAEMVTCIENYGTEHFFFFDDTLTLDRNYILKLCRLIKPLGITFEGSTRANLVDEEVISALADAGLIRLSFGLESVNPEIRKTIRKEVPLESYTTANRLTNKYKIETLNSCMIGLPGETVETIRETLCFLRHSREVKQANLAIAVPYPGTELHSMAVKGKHGLKLLTEDYSKFWRYGSSVMNVGELTPKDLIQLQNDAFASIYFAPWRWIPLIKKQGLMGAVLTFFRMLKSFKRIILNKNGFFRFREKYGK